MAPGQQGREEEREGGVLNEGMDRKDNLNMDDAMSRVKEVMGDLDAHMAELRVAAEQEIEDIRKSRRALEEDKIRFEQESKRVHQVLNESEQVGVL